MLTGAGDTLDSMFMLNAHWTINGPISGPGGLMLNGWARNDGGGMPNIIGSQTQTLTLAGTNTYGGATTINFGRLVVTGGSAITDTSAVIVSTRSAWGGNAGSATTTLNIAEIRVDASETIGSLAGGNASRGVVNINGPAVTLTTGVDDRSTTYSGGIIGTGGLSKDGTGTFAMNGIKSYAGDTTVLAGTLSTNRASFADLSGVYLSSGSLLNLNFVGIDTVDSLFVDGLQRRSGIWRTGVGPPTSYKRIDQRQRFFASHDGAGTADFHVSGRCLWNATGATKNPFAAQAAFLSQRSSIVGAVGFHHRGHRGHGAEKTRRKGDKETRAQTEPPCLLVSPSPPHVCGYMVWKTALVEWSVPTTVAPVNHRQSIAQPVARLEQSVPSAGRIRLDTLRRPGWRIESCRTARSRAAR